MSGWLTTATNVFRRKSDGPPQTYELRCGCGQIIAGQRTGAEQTTTCPACLAPLFILPACVYPLPKSPPKKPARAPRPSLDDETLANGQKGTTQGHSGASRSRRRSPSSAKRSEATEQVGFHERLRRAIEPAHLDRLRRKWLTPLRMVLLGIGLVVFATAWWMGHLRALDRARNVLASVPRSADEALQEGNAPEAARQFALLRHAVDLLGRDDSQSRRWRQLARETAAIADLAAAPLHDILHEAAEAADDGTGGSAWPSVFRANYRDGWILIDAPVGRDTQASGRGECSVDFPLASGEQRGKLIAELPALEPALAADGSARRIIFAAQLADCRLEPGPTPIWRIELRPETGFLWSGVETYRMLGMPTDDGSLEVLAAQARLLGIEP